MARALIAIDGAASSALEESVGRTYGQHYTNSFVLRIYRASSCEFKKYLPGPPINPHTTRGSIQSIVDIGRQAEAWALALPQGTAIYMVGYSRGAAACVSAAVLISRRAASGYAYDHRERRPLLDQPLMDFGRVGGRVVVFMGLFDPVANQLGYSDGALDTNCQHIAIRCARRSEDGAGSVVFPQLAISGGVFRQRTFSGTHSDLGGHQGASERSLPAFHWIRDGLRQNGGL